MCPDKCWHRCLKSGIDADNRRLSEARRREFDSRTHKVSFYDRIYASAGPYMNGHPMRMETAESLTDSRVHHSRYTDDGSRY
jgi:hypothetical protein